MLHLKFLFLKKKMCFRLTVQNELIQSVGFDHSTAFAFARAGLLVGS
jgi:hypothetical protein